MQAKCRLTRMSKQRKNRNCKISSLGQKNNSIRTHKCLPERYGRRVDSSAHCRDSCSAVQMCTPPNSLSTSLSGSSCWDVFLGTPSSRSIFFFRADVGRFHVSHFKRQHFDKRMVDLSEIGGMFRFIGRAILPGQAMGTWPVP